MGRENLEKRISKFYADSSDSDTVIQYLVAVLIRHSLCISDFSDFCSDLIREILLFAEPTDVLRKCGPLFQNYFKEEKEWAQVKNRLYKNKNEYHRFNNRLSDCKNTYSPQQHLWRKPMVSNTRFFPHLKMQSASFIHGVCGMRTRIPLG